LDRPSCDRGADLEAFGLEGEDDALQLVGDAVPSLSMSRRT
jgi:hypothetical protein